MSITEYEQDFLAARRELAELEESLSAAADEGQPLHEVERGLWKAMLHLGLRLLKGYVAQQGDGDVGETLELPSGRRVRRLKEAHERRYVSVFGEFKIRRRVYGTRRKQRFEAAPLDARLELPESDFSYLLQEWAQAFCVHQSFGESRELLEKILEIGLSVGALERMSRSMGEAVAAFVEEQPTPEDESEGELMVLMADGKGIPTCRGAEDPRPADPKHLKKGEKKNKKQIAHVGTSHTVDPFPRTVEDVLGEMDGEVSSSAERPRPRNKRIRAEFQEEPAAGREALFQWLGEELARRNPEARRPVVFLSDGEAKLEELARQQLGEFVSVLDVMHVIPRLWEAAHCFHAEGSDDARQFVNGRLAKILYGEADLVVRGLRQMTTKRRLRGRKRKTMARITQYLENNYHRMKYNEYLEAGYPIGTGVVEGACRHLVKDRFERSGMRWTVPGARALLALRATYINGDWEPFCQSRIHHETQRLYPYRQALLAAHN